MKVKKLAAAMLRDRQRQATSSSAIDCFLCGRSFTYQGARGDDSGRFCSDNCRDRHTAGLRKNGLPKRKLDPKSPSLGAWRAIAQKSAHRMGVKEDPWKSLPPCFRPVGTGNFFDRGSARFKAAHRARTVRGASAAGNAATPQSRRREFEIASTSSLAVLNSTT